MSAGRPRDARALRPVEPAPEEPDPRELFDPAEAARPWAALLLALGVPLAVAAMAGWARLFLGAPMHPPPPFRAGALVQDILLLLLFILPHSLLARGFGRRFLNRPLGPAGERPLFVLQSSLLLGLLALAWQPCGPALWDHAGLLLLASRVLQVVGLLLAAWGAGVVGGGSLIGLPHLAALRSGRQPPPEELVALPPYRWLRQPINAGLLLFLLGTPEGTLDRLLLVAGTALWILLATPFEERDNEVTFGNAWRSYRERTPRWLPRIRLGEEE